MAEQTNTTEAKAAAQAPAKIAETTADTAQKLVTESAKAGKRARAATARRAKRTATPRKTETTVKVATKRTTGRRTKTTQRAAKAAPRSERIENVNFKATFPTFGAFPAFGTSPATTGLQSLFADAGERSQDAVRRSQRMTEEMTDMARGTVEALAEAGRIAADGARSLSRDVIAKSREGVEEAADAIRTLAEAKSPTEFVQLQSEIARASFDRMVAESSRFTETLVKLAGEAVQPLSNRATVNAERVNSFVA